jgi:hypothetical protein
LGEEGGFPGAPVIFNNTALYRVVIVSKPPKTSPATHLITSNLVPFFQPNDVHPQQHFSSTPADREKLQWEGGQERTPCHGWINFVNWGDEIDRVFLCR